MHRIKTTLAFLLQLLFFGSAVGQQAGLVDFQKIEATVFPNAQTASVHGQVSVQFTILQDTPSVFLDAVNFTEVLNLGGTTLTNTGKRLVFTSTFKAGQPYTVSFSYTAKPKQTLYFTGGQIWTQGQGKYTSHWLPSLDSTNDKIEFDLTLKAPRGKTAIANGKLLHKKNEAGYTFWQYDMQRPMSSYLVALAIGDFKKKAQQSATGHPIELYIKPEDLKNHGPTYRYTKQLFDFFETEIGVPFPWQNYKQVPVRDFLYAGMENTTLTIFSEAFVVDSIAFPDRNYVNVNAHELAHQWFGNLVTATNGTHHWLHEGFATYYALLAEKQIFGAGHYYWKLYTSAENLKALSAEGKGEGLLDPGASSLTFYEKGAWALHTLRELVGERAFKQAIKKYLETHKYKNVTTGDFLAEVKKVAPVPISQWEENWLEQPAFPAEVAHRSLKKSPSLQQYFSIVALRQKTLGTKTEPLAAALASGNQWAGQEAVQQLAQEPIAKTETLYKKAFASNNLFVRQAIARTMVTIPQSLKTEYETLLQDPSYVTKEAALLNLWQNFPNGRAAYLNETAHIVGFQDRSFRQLWLVLAVLTEGYMPKKVQGYLSELRAYTGPGHSFEIRGHALGHIHQLMAWTPATLQNLISAAVHHNWRFRTGARKIVNSVLRHETLRAQLRQLLPGLPEGQRKFLVSVL